MREKWLLLIVVLVSPLLARVSTAQDVFSPLVSDPGYAAAVEAGSAIPLNLSAADGGYTFYLTDAYFDSVRVILNYEAHPRTNVPHVSTPSLFHYFNLELSSGDLRYSLRQNTMQNQAGRLVGQAQFDHSLAFYDPDKEEFLPCHEDCPDTEPAWHESFALRMTVDFEPHGLVSVDFPFTVPDKETYYSRFDLEHGLLYGIYGGTYFPPPEEWHTVNDIGAWWNFVRLDVMTSAVRACFDLESNTFLPHGYMRAGDLLQPFVVYKQYNLINFSTGEPYTCVDLAASLPASAYTLPAVELVVESLEYDGQTVEGPWLFYTGSP